jgi:hypothetical protein
MRGSVKGKEYVTLGDGDPLLSLGASGVQTSVELEGRTFPDGLAPGTVNSRDSPA